MNDRSITLSHIRVRVMHSPTMCRVDVRVITRVSMGASVRPSFMEVHASLIIMDAISPMFTRDSG